MNKSKFLILILAAILISVCTVFAYDIIYEKMNRMIDKSGLKQEILNSQSKNPSRVSIISPVKNESLYSSTIIVQGTASGEKLEYIEVRLDSVFRTGLWQKAVGTESWQSTFYNCTNGSYTIRARAYDIKGVSEEAVITLTIDLSTNIPIVKLISGPTNSLVTNNPFTNRLTTSDKYGYWSTNGTLHQFNTGTTQSIIIRTNSIFKYYGQNPGGYMSSVKTIEYVWGTWSQGLSFSLIGSNAYEVSHGTATGGSVTIPKYYNGFPVTSIGINAFWSCSGLTRITIPSSITSIGNQAFYNCTSLGNLIIPNSVTTIGTSAFGICNGLISVVIPENVTSIGNTAFTGCTGLKNVIFPDNVNSFGRSMFNNCTELTNVKFPNNITSITDYTFYYCLKLKQVTMPPSLTSIGNLAFTLCSALAKITIPPNVAIIGNYAFYSCSSLTSLTIPQNVTSISNNAFELCSGLTNITMLRTNAPAIGVNVFANCSALSKIYVPNNAAVTNYKHAANWTVWSNLIFAKP